MKNTTNSIALLTGKKLTLLLSTVFLINTGSNAQSGHTQGIFQPKAGFGMSTVTSCNSFGMQYVPSFSVNFGKGIEISAGPAFNKETVRFTGIQAKAAFYFLNAEDSYCGNTSLYNIIIFENHVNQSFNQKWVEIEKWTSRNCINSEFDFSSIRFRGKQVSLGFGVKHNFGERFSAHFNLAVSYFQSSRINHQDIPLYYESKGFGLHLSAGIQYAFGRYSR